MATIRIPPILRPEAGGNRQVEAPGATVREVLENLVTTYPALRGRIFDGDELPQFLNVFVDGSDVRLFDGLDTAVSRRATVILLPAVAGGVTWELRSPASPPPTPPPAGERRRSRRSPTSVGVRRLERKA